ncbi:hypothetical protein SAMN05216266_108145 [Amycolatopsis marina]|uniref:Uncharacterized protein n=1 Tax=Amycolatopsis marina TaxID=490629 RepID=A0A1I1A321_9PSEU|nr:DUF6350 family protein [Amycolatopsis marina]SFB32369.1 hypothetical protein SAMN05216266_108145 [Amycolatopsis marina]
MQLLTSPSRQEGGDGQGDREAAATVSGGMRARALITAAVAPLVTGYVAVAALLTAVTSTATQGKFDPVEVLLAAGPSWLATYQVPVEIDGRTLGLLPLLPTIGVFVLVMRTAARAARRLDYREPAQAVTLVGAIAGTHATAGAVISALADGYRLDVEPLPGFLVPGLVAGLAALVGTAGRCGMLAWALRYLDPLALHGLRAGALAVAALLTVGAMTLTMASALSASAVHELFQANALGLGDGAGLLLLSLGYLPNAVLAGLGFAAGPGFSIGAATLTPVGFVGGPAPALPLFAAVPESHAVWWPALMLLPAAAGALVGWSQRRIDQNPGVRVRVVVVAGALAAFGVVVLGALAGGRLGGGPFDPVSFPLGTLSIAVFVWIVLPGALMTYYGGPHASAESEQTATAAEPAEDTGAEDTESGDVTEGTDDGEGDTESADDGEGTEDGESTEDTEETEETEETEDAGEAGDDGDSETSPEPPDTGAEGDESSTEDFEVLDVPEGTAIEFEDEFESDDADDADDADDDPDDDPDGTDADTEIAADEPRAK